MAKRRSPPEAYLDGCTLAPNQLGSVSHVDICDEHDRAYWERRTFLDKVRADLRWSARIIWRHRRNWPWQPIALVLAIGGFVGISTVGLWMWKRRHRWDRN